MIGTYNYYLYTGDEDFIQQIWPQYVAAMNYSLNTIIDSGIVNVTGAADWGRWTYATERSSASMLFVPPTHSKFGYCSNNLDFC